MERHLPLLALAALALGAPAATAQSQEPGGLEWSGDFRLRAESNQKLPDADARNRARLRFRLGANYQATEHLKLGFRARTGNPDDPNSPHQDLGGTGSGGVFNSFEFNLDRAYLHYAPDWAPGLGFFGGKFHRPGFRNPVYGELAWDDDVQPEGYAFTYAGETGGMEWDAYLGQYILLEQGGTEDAWMLNAGAHGRVESGESSRFDVALNYFFYGDTTPGSSTAILGDNQGNALATGGNDFLSEFGILDPVVAWTTTDFGQPLTLSGEFLLNTRAAAGVGDQGWALGAAWGSTSAPGDSKFYYQYQSIEQDAIFSAFCQDDFLLGSNQDAHVLGWKQQLADNVGLHVWALVSAPNEAFGGDDDNRYRFRVDLNLSF
jgi:hypothetical protein